MNNLLLSNTNLMITNSIWKELFKNNKIIFHENFEILIPMNNRKLVEKYNHIICVIYLNDLVEFKKNSFFDLIVNTIKNNQNKNFTVLFFLRSEGNHFLDKKNEVIIFKQISKINAKKLPNLSIKIFLDNSKHIFDRRNETILRCPFSLDGLSLIINNIQKLIKLEKVKPFKLIILDCDNTLWGGVVGEDGLENVKYSEDDEGKIFEKIQKHLKNLKSQGILLTLSSKNNPKDVWKALSERNMKLKRKDFLLPKINWEEKSRNIYNLLNELELRDEDVLFIDDNKLEREKVKNEFKSISILDSSDPIYFYDNLLSHPKLQIKNVLKEDQKKHKQYILKNKFKKLVKSRRTDGEIFSSLKQKIKFLNINSSNINRAEQLFNKTNQFNFSSTRYQKNDLKKISLRQNYNLKLLSLSDKFGDHGIIGAFITYMDKDFISIEEFILSCRVLSRKIEEFILLHICKKNSKKKILLRYIKNNNNKILIENFIKKNSFKEHKVKFTKENKKKAKYLNILENQKLKNVERFF